jgi:hypothetical protein
MFKRPLLAFSVLLCSTVFGADAPDWLKEARARESKSLKSSALKSKDGWFKVSSPGKLVGAIEKVEGSYTVELDVGSDANVYCEVYPEGIDMANALRVTLESSMKEIESNQGKLEARVLESTDAGAHGGVPHITLTWLYRVATPDGARVGGFKQFVMEKGDQGVYCAHNELGYTRTFSSITQAFASSLTTKEPGGTPHFVEIASVSMSGAKIGVAITALERDGEGDTKARQTSALLIATEDGVVQSQDSTQIHWVRPDGTLINAANTEVSNGEIANDLGLKLENGVWTVEGEVQGKTVRATLPKDSRPGSFLGQALELRALLAQPNAVGREHTMGIWLAENPEKLTVAKTRILAKKDAEHFTARGEIGGLTADLTLEKATGLASVADLKVGPVKMTLERVYLNGSF